MNDYITEPLSEYTSITKSVTHGQCDVRLAVTFLDQARWTASVHFV